MDATRRRKFGGGRGNTSVVRLSIFVRTEATFVIAIEANVFMVVHSMSSNAIFGVGGHLLFSFAVTSFRHAAPADAG